MHRRARKSLAAETLRILDSGRYTANNGEPVDINESLNACLVGTHCYLPNELRALSKRVTEHRSEWTTMFEVHDQTALDGADALTCRPDAGRVGVLNFASARNPGGGFLGGSQAQEESLARSTGLYKSLLQCPEYYEHHRAHADLLYSHRIIYSPQCPVFRNDAGALLPRPYAVDILSCAAPNAGAIRRNQPSSACLIEATLRERIAFLLTLATHCRIESLVLGAWGCGVFGNDAATVAASFEHSLAAGGLFEGRFRRIRFSVADRTRDRRVLNAFVRHWR